MAANKKHGEAKATNGMQLIICAPSFPNELPIFQCSKLRLVLLLY